MDDDTAAAARRIGEVLGGKWTLERLIGTGGMAAVYAARDPSGAVAAVKLLHAEMTLRRDVRERFLREAYVANRIDHPGAVRVIEHGGGGDGEPAYIVMELLEGQTLADRAKAGMGTAELLDTMDQILDVLDHAHQQGVIHRDLKPDNLFVGTDGRVKVLDFGLARMLDEMPGDFKTRTGMALGTLPYMAPEQALGRRDELDGRADIFALGATAFRIASGRKLHEANSEAELLMAMASKPAPPLASVAPSVPSDVCAVIDLALAFSKDARYPDAATMQRDVRDVRAGRRPAFATSRGTQREEATRLDMPAVAAPSSRRIVGATMPLQAIDAPPPSTAAFSVDTARAATMPAGPFATATSAAVHPPPTDGAATAQRRRSLLPLLLALGFVAVLLGVGIVALAYMAESSSVAPADASAAASARAAPAAPGAAAPEEAIAASAPAPDPTAPLGAPGGGGTAAPTEPAAATPTEPAPATPNPTKPASAPATATAPPAAPKPAATAPATAAAKTAAVAAPAAPSKPAPKPPSPPPPPAPAPAPPSPSKPGNSAHGHGASTVTHGHAHGH